MTHTSPSNRTVLAVIWIPVLAYGAVLTMPGFLAVLGKDYGMSSSELGTLASAEWFLCITGTFLSNNRTIRQLSRWVLWTGPLAVIVNVAAIFFAGKVPLVYFHPLSTFASGISYGLALKVFDASGRQQRYYGIFLAVFTLSELAVFQLLHYLTIAIDSAAVFVVYATLAACAVLITWCVRKSLEQVEDVGRPGHSGVANRPKTWVLASVGALGVSYIAFGMIWSFVQLMGVARSFSPAVVTNGSSAYAVTGVLGALAAAALPSGVNRSTVLIISLIALLGSIYMMYVSPGAWWFIAGCGIFGVYWTFYCATHVSLIAQSDGTGRAIVFSGIAPSVGAVIGSFWGGRLISGADYSPTAEIGSLMAIIGIALTIYTLIKIGRPPQAEAPLASTLGSR